MVYEISKIVLTVLAGLVVALACIWLIFWVFGQKSFPLTYGVSFNQHYARSFGLDWQRVYVDMLKELQPSHVRVAAMWNDVEPADGMYDFSSVDFMMDEAQKYGAEVVLVVGQKAPRWPECHVPEWVSADKQERRTQLLRYVEKTVQRYKDHSALELWQVENEPYITFTFGECDRYDEGVVQQELARVRALDEDHEIIMTDSGELGLWKRVSEQADVLGTTLYRVVRTPSGMRFDYDWLPAGFYRLKARLWGNEPEDFFVSELQAEPWFSGGAPIDTPVKVQEETMDPARMQKNLQYATRVGASRAYLWGVEWWYWMREAHDDARYWELAKDVFVAR